MVDAGPRQAPQHGGEVLQRGGVRVELGVPPGEVVHPPGEPLDAGRVRVGAAAEGEAHRPHPGPVELAHLLVRDGGRQLGHADESGAELRQRRAQPLLGVALEGAADHGPARHAQFPDPAPVVPDREGRRQVPLVGYQREPRVDHVQVGVDHAVILPETVGRCAGAGRSGGATGVAPTLVASAHIHCMPVTTTVLTPDHVLQAAEEALDRARRSYARKLLRLVAAELARRHPDAVRLDVLGHDGDQEFFVDALRDAAGDYVWGDPGRVVVVRETADDELGGTVTVAARDVRELVGRALDAYAGPLERLLHHDEQSDTYWLDLTAP